MSRMQKFFSIAGAWLYILGVALLWHYRYGGLPQAGLFFLMLMGLAIAAIIVLSKFKPTGS